jgi:murein L,D-transpeptidase YafK
VILSRIEAGEAAGSMRRLVLSALVAVAACTSVQPPPPAYDPPSRPEEVEQIASLLRIRKAARTLEVWSGTRLLLTLSGVQLGRHPLGPKQFEGDGRTPEGRYLIDWRNPHSAYHLSLHVSYPNGQQVLAARNQGRAAGSMIMIHGQPNGYEGRVTGDWTDGCIALSDTEIETLWDIVPDGAVVEILP